MNGRSFRLWWVGAGFLLVLLVAACGKIGGDDDTGDDATDDDAGDDAGDDTGGGCGSADLLTGVWVSDQLTLDLLTNGVFYAIGVNQAQYNVSGSWSVSGCTISFVDLAGTGACPQTQTGAYGFVVTDTSLTTTLESDPCAGRATGMDGAVFTRGS